MDRVKDDRGGTVMTVDRLYRHLLQKLINANIDIDAYLQLRKAKGYMSVSENDHLRDNLFELCREMRARRRACSMSFHRRKRMPFVWPASPSPPLQYA
jgi:biofilm regulator BssR